jgi:hypothetical protein
VHPPLIAENLRQFKDWRRQNEFWLLFNHARVERLDQRHQHCRELPGGEHQQRIRQIAADGRSLYDTVNGLGVTGYMPITGGAFTGSISRSSSGGYWYFNSSSLVGGAVYVQPVSSALPTSPAEGTVVFQY